MPVCELTAQEAEVKYWAPWREQARRELEYAEWHLFGFRDGTPKPECPSRALRNMQKWEPTCKRTFTAI